MLYPKATKIALLQSKFHRITKHQMTKALKPFGLNIVEWTILGYLDHINTLTSLSRVSEEVGIQDSFVTVLCSKMEKSGLVKIIPDKADKRRKNIQITKEGKKIVSIMQEQFIVYFSPLFKGLKEVDIANFLSVLKKIIKNFDSRLM
jgi:DNA-binding MarR family transcriptional regulator